jgi:serine/threonine-protein kinase
MSVHPLQLGGPTHASRFGDYRLVRLVATGGTAEVWVASDASDTPVVLKRLLPSVADDPAFVDMLRREAVVLSALEHPNIARFRGFGDVDGWHFIAMEHVDGHDVRAIVQRMRDLRVRAFPLEQAVAIGLGVCAALGHAHGSSPLGVVHRDITAENVVVSFAGETKLVDFGFAGAADAPGSVRGKPGYMSPEQVRGETLDGRSDVFALGILVFELTTGKRLFKGESDYETMMMIRDRDVVRPGEVRPGYPAGLEPIVLRALARDRAARTPTAHVFESELAAFARGEGHGAPRDGLRRFMASLWDKE